MITSTMEKLYFFLSFYPSYSLLGLHDKTLILKYYIVGRCNLWYIIKILNIWFYIYIYIYNIFIYIYNILNETRNSKI